MRSGDCKLATNAIFNLIEEMVVMSVRSQSRIRPRSKLSADLEGLLVEVTDQSAAHYVTRFRGFIPDGPWRCLDLGCGNAPHRAVLEAEGGSWTGCDYAASTDPATLARMGSNLEGRIKEYDGLYLPFEDSSFDGVWSWQALEHVQNPEITFAEISRILRSGGLLAGSTSFLEPYHAQSTFSYTPYGFKLICERHGMAVREIAPSLDGFAYLVKKIFQILALDDGPEIQKSLTDKSPLEPIRQRLISEGRATEWPHLLAQVCGTFRFTVVKK